MVDSSRPGSLRICGNLKFENEVRNVVVQDAYAFVMVKDKGLYVIDIVDPFYMSVVGSFGLDGSANALSLSDDLLYVADPKGGIWILRFVPPAHE